MKVNCTYALVISVQFAAVDISTTLKVWLYER